MSHTQTKEAFKMNDWHNIYITDKSGNKFFNTDASPMATASEIKNLTRHLDKIKASVKGYEFADSQTATMMLDDTPYKAMSEILDDDDLLLELFS